MYVCNAFVRWLWSPTGSWRQPVFVLLHDPVPPPSVWFAAAILPSSTEEKKREGKDKRNTKERSVPTEPPPAPLGSGLSETAVVAFAQISNRNTSARVIAASVY